MQTPVESNSESTSERMRPRLAISPEGVGVDSVSRRKCCSIYALRSCRLCKAKDDVASAGSAEGPAAASAHSKDDAMLMKMLFGLVWSLG